MFLFFFQVWPNELNRLTFLWLVNTYLKGYWTKVARFCVAKDKGELFSFLCVVTSKEPMTSLNKLNHLKVPTVQ